jgi:hypothetical protein
VSRVRENLTHGSMRRREETNASRLHRARRQAPPADPTCVVCSDYEVRIASLRVSDTGRTRPSLSRFRPLRRRNSSDRQREKRPQSLDDVLAGEAPRRCDQVKANSGGRMTTTVAAHRAKTGR